MWLTILVIAIFFGLLIVQTVTWAALLKLGLWWAKAPSASLARVALAAVAVFVLQLVVTVYCEFLGSKSPTAELVSLLIGLVAAVAVPVGIIAKLFQLNVKRSLQAWLPTLIPTGSALVFVFFVFRPFVYEAFTIPTNAMAPTIAGQHLEGVCPKCGATTYGSAAHGSVDFTLPTNMICEKFHVQELVPTEPRIYSGDLILVAKFLEPKRWDVVVFQFPEEPSTLYVKRLVGLPGETITIEAGALYANGTLLEPPESLQGLEHLSEMPGLFPGEKIWGTQENPARLADDEYFVLGDFSAMSKDSRLWTVGAPGHPPYAVPRAYMRGVVTHIYWPPRRMRSLR